MSQLAPPSARGSSSTQPKVAAEVGGGPRWRRLALASALLVGAGLLASPWLWFSVGGLLPTLGTILIAGVLGQLWAHRIGRPGHLRYALGAAIASGALFTGWSDVSNGLFLLAGALTAVTGLSAGRRAQPGPR